MSDLAAALRKKGADKGLRDVYGVAHSTQDHKGGKCTGIAYVNGSSQIEIHKESCSVSMVFSPQGQSISKLREVSATNAMIYQVHTDDGIANASSIPPAFRHCDNGLEFVVAQNGRISNKAFLEQSLGRKFCFDSELIAEIILNYFNVTQNMASSIRQTMNVLKGYYKAVVMTRDNLYAFKDSSGTNFMVLGENEDMFILASETCGLDAMEAKIVCWLEPGEVLEIGRRYVIHRRKGLERPNGKPCAFNFNLLWRPDSFAPNGSSVHAMRRALGRYMGQKNGVEADLVIEIPDSGRPYALGYAEGSGIPFEIGIIKTRYPAEGIELPAEMKHAALSDVVKGKRIALIDATKLTGGTGRTDVRLLKNAGAKEVHLRTGSPPVTKECFKGYKRFDGSQLIASFMKPHEIAVYSGADSYAAITYSEMEAVYNTFGFDSYDFCSDCLQKD